MSVRETIRRSGGEEVRWWIADFKDGNGRRHQVRFRHKKDATAYEEKSKVSVREGQFVTVDHNMTVEKAVDVWLNRVEANGMRHKGPVERSTIRQYRQHRAHIVSRIGDQKLRRLTKETVEHFRDGLLEGVKDKNGRDSIKPLSRALARKVLISFKSVLKANKVGHVAEDVAIGIDKRHKRKLEVGKDMPTPAEIRRLIKAATTPRIRALLMIAAMAGLRASELRGLRWSDVDLKAQELTVRQRADRFNKIGNPKSGESGRTIPIPPEAVVALKEWKLACPKSDLDLVFPTRTGAVEHHKNMLRSLGPVMKATGVVAKDGSPKYALHAFRHFFASWCINSIDRGGRQLPAKVAQELLGHSSIVMTMDVYGHMFPRGDDRTELSEQSKRLLGG
jgi:integrase